MGGFKRALLGYRRAEVDAAIASRDTRIWALEREAEDSGERLRSASGALARAEQELTSLSGMVLEREREIRGLEERLREANERHDRSIASLESTAGRLEEIQAQARGQATRIRMKALSEAVEVSRRREAAENGAAQNGAAQNDSGLLDSGLFEGDVKLQIGPLGDFSQLVGFEDVIAGLGASEISVERFSEGRATLSVHLDEPVELLRELEERAPLDFRVRRTGDDVILDVEDEQDSGRRAA
ncbi:MAG TPA: hypothetical protein VGB06_03070 [Solirubrobacterales bacterium]|jgi:hypothetical protein